MFIDYSNPDNVVIKHKETINTGRLFSYNKTWWLHVEYDSNYYPFHTLNVDASSFIKNVVGYHQNDVTVKSKEDLIKVLDALNKEYDRQFGSEEYINIKNCKNGDYLYIEDAKFKAIYIFRECQGNIMYRHAFYRCDCGDLDTDEGYLDIKSTTKIRKATSNEIQTLNNALLVQKGLFWNPISKQLEKTGLSVDTSTDKIIADKDPNYYNYYCGSEQPLTPSETVPNISIKTFIKPKKHYQLNFNN